MSSQSYFEALMAPGDHYPRCSWPFNFVSTTRDLDVSQCFEHIVVMPLPLVLAILIALYRIISIKRGLRNGKLVWNERLSGSRRLCNAKMVCFLSSSPPSTLTNADISRLYCLSLRSLRLPLSRCLSLRHKSPLCPQSTMPSSSPQSFASSP
jgi:hypothetical protein